MRETGKMKKTATKSDPDEVFLQLDGQVSLVEKYKGKKSKKYPIDGKLVLQVVLQAIEDGLNRMESDIKSKTSIDT